MLPEPPEYVPLGDLISEARRRLSLSLSGAARAMQKAAQEEGTYCGATRQTILGYERGRIPHPDALRWLAAAVGLPVDEVVTAAERQRKYRLQMRLLASSGAGGVFSGPECATLD
ncbi:MAG: helix-turn-helix domain-containing protein, partial [Actinomycetota bacterium]